VLLFRPPEPQNRYTSKKFNTYSELEAASLARGARSALIKSQQK
jgi:hypothetical protein